jgi:SAM-dependent MidA family methyltransferase
VTGDGPGRDADGAAAEAVLGLRRPDGLQARPDPGDEPALLDLIRSEIEADGPLTFARFMELALYHPDLGYYAAGTRGPGREADFLTAPEAHPLFGWAVARQLEELWDRLGRPERFTVREHGAGTGALAASIVDGLRRSSSPLANALRYRIVERSRRRERQVVERLAAMGAEGVLEPDDGFPITGAVLANEVLDALPVHRVEGRPDGGFDELFVGLDGLRNLVSVVGPPHDPRLRERLEAEGIGLAPGQRAEVCLAIDDWMAGAAAGLERGLLVIVDYGHPAATLYDPVRGSLLRAYVRHRVHDDPYVNVGRQDLTAHVDLTAVASAAAAAGLIHLGTTTQAAFLAGLEAGELLVALRSDPATTLQGYLDARSALLRMLDPGATGAFAVVAFGRGLAGDVPLAGLGFRLPARDAPRGGSR